MVRATEEHVWNQLVGGLARAGWHGLAGSEHAEPVKELKMAVRERDEPSTAP